MQSVLYQMPVRIFFAALALLSAVSLAVPAALAAEPGSSEAHASPVAKIAPITKEAFDEMLVNLVEEKGGVQSEQGDTLRVELAEEARVLFFTRPGHRAHPGIVAVSIIEEDGVPSLDTSGWWAGDAQAFEVWFRVFERHNARLSREWQQY